MQKQVTPAMIVVALIVLVIIIGLIWYFTMGRRQPAPTEEEMNLDPAMMDEPPGGVGPGAQPERTDTE